MCAKSEQDAGEHSTGDPASISVPLPVRDGDLFKHKATADVLHLLSQYPFSRYTLRELARRTGHSVNSVRSAVDVLQANELVTAEREGNARPVAINRARLSVPENATLSIPQPDFHLPVHVAVEKIRRELEAVNGIVLFGSVANGTADRKSDIDLWVLVGKNRLREQQTANRLSTELSEVVFPPAPSTVAPKPAPLVDLPEETDPIEALPEIKHGDRFDFQILVETPESTGSRADGRMAEILTEGVVLFRTETLAEVVTEVTAPDG